MEGNIEAECSPPSGLASAILADPAASRWLRDALRSALVRDPVDAANEAEVLARVLADRVAEAMIVSA